MSDVITAVKGQAVALNTEEDISFVYKYDGYDFEKINYYLRSTKNDRNILEKAIYLDSISSLTNRGV